MYHQINYTFMGLVTKLIASVGRRENVNYVNLILLVVKFT